MQVRPMVFGVAWLLVILTGVTCGADQVRTGGQVVDTVCGRCHPKAKVCRNLGRDRAFWSATVGRMISNGASLKTAEVDGTAKHLAGLKGGDPSVCR